MFSRMPFAGTLAGQYVMEGFMRWKIPMWFRVLITRTIALGPALAFAILQVYLFTIGTYGHYVVLG